MDIKRKKKYKKYGIFQLGQTSKFDEKETSKKEKEKKKLISNTKRLHYVKPGKEGVVGPPTRTFSFYPNSNKLFSTHT